MFLVVLEIRNKHCGVPENFGLYFIILTLIGGSVFSTTSGLKFLRIYILIKAFFMEMYKS